MPHYLIVAQREYGNVEQGEVFGPVEAVNPESAVSEYGCWGFDEFTVYPLGTDPSGDVQTYTKEVLESPEA